MQAFYSQDSYIVRWICSKCLCPEKLMPQEFLQFPLKIYVTAVDVLRKDGKGNFMPRESCSRKLAWRAFHNHFCSSKHSRTVGFCKSKCWSLAFFLTSEISNFCQIAKLKSKFWKWKWVLRISISRSPEEKVKQCQISIFGFNK